MNHYLQLSKKTDLWEVLSNNFYSIFYKNIRKAINRILLRYSWKLFIKIFIKVVAVSLSKWKIFQKQTFHLSTYFYCARQKSKHNYISIKKTHPISLTFFSSKFLLFILVFHLLCVSNNKCSHRRCSIKKVAIRNFAKFTGKHLCQSLFFNKVADLAFAKFLRTPF